MKYRSMGAGPDHRREVSVLALGAMLFGSVTDEKTSFAVLDRYAEAGGNFVDTSDNYAFWVDGSQGGQSEELLGRWRRSRGVGDEIVFATKLGARPLAPGTGYTDNPEGLSAKAIREACERSRERLGLERIDLLYAHIEDRTVDIRETVEAFGELVAEGAVGLLGASNHAVWRVERARVVAAAAGLPGYEVLQYQHSLLRPRTDLPDELFPDGSLGGATGELLGYLRAEPALTLVAYSPLLRGAYGRTDKPLPPDYDHPGTPPRLAALQAVARETGATPNQVVLAWQLGSDLPVIPLVGMSSVAQLEENLAAVDLELTPEQRERLDTAH
ncbi:MULTISPECIES: aldo/keto reductase [unclassified Streptomyces]|uniref:aldo/keto reductase n=1 Tax=unclassified Streptomyces TaxID=2593676 RepID=UPI0011CDC20B|nr:MULTISPECIES: aldo/keto reductase [unclassified Streptomyces]TXS69192.1 aldo/keto reductase [Streptomyces sp. me109]